MMTNTILEWWSFLRNKRKVLDPNDPKKVLRFKKGKKGLFTLDPYPELKFIEDPYTRNVSSKRAAQLTSGLLLGLLRTAK